MKVYAFDLLPWPYLEQPSYYPDPNSLFDPERGREVYEQHLQQMAAYEELGFDAVCINEHHSKPYGLMPSPNIVAAALIQRTSRIPIGLFGNLPALHANPIRLAEEIAMLDCMSGGRIVSGFVRGVPQEYLALTGSLAESRERLEEAWDLIVKAWTVHEPFRWEGKHFHYDHVSIWPRPLQQPHPPIVLPAESDDGLRLAARRRVPTGSAYRPAARTKAIFDKYRQYAAEYGWTPSPEDCMVLRPVYVAETMAEAREEAEPHINYFWQKLLAYHRGAAKLLGQVPSTASERPLYEYDLDLTQKEGLGFIGDPDYVFEAIKQQMRELGAGVLMGLFQFGSLPHELATKNARLFAQTVLPELRRL
ncbi:MAG TPA: LLM class flavin-dependent oxidoreductase [Dehalococcoidia bacterium]|nr:LLM class flavin-dependent oxidoreductase [Dehalococcoidia bacterium]